MAADPTQFVRGGVNDALIPELWSRTDYQQAFEANPFARYMASADNSLYSGMPIVVGTQLDKGAGDRITLPMVRLVEDDGQTDDGDYDDNAGKLNFLDSQVTIHERGHTLANAGMYTEQINYHGQSGLRSVTQDQLTKWVGQIMYSDQIAALSGIEAVTLNGGWVSGVKAQDADANNIETVNIEADATNHLYYDSALTTGNKSDSSIRWLGAGYNPSTDTVTRYDSDSDLTVHSTTNRFGTGIISEAKDMAINQAGVSGDGDDIQIAPITPIMIGGKDYYLMFITSEMLRDLRAEDAWREAQSNANMRGEDNPLFSGAEGIWNGVVLHRLERLHKRLGAGGTTASEYFDGSSGSTADVLASGVRVGRALFVGASALVQVYGQMPRWTQGFLDSASKTKWGIHTDFIYGLKTPTFALQYVADDSSPDEVKYPYGVIQVDVPIRSA